MFWSVALTDLTFGQAFEAAGIVVLLVLALVGLAEVIKPFSRRPPS